MPRKVHSNMEGEGHAKEHLGPFQESKESEEFSHQQLLHEISDILDRKLASLATKEDINDLKNIIDQQSLKIEMLEAKIVLMEKYKQRIESLEKRATVNDGDMVSVNERLNQLELRADYNEQYHRRLCLRITGVELSERSDGESGPECFQKVKKILKEDLNVDIPNMSIDRAHRIGSVIKDPDTGKRYRQIIVRVATWRHRTQAYKARKATNKVKIRLDLTHKRVKMLQKVNGLLKDADKCFIFADINCRLCLKLNNEYRYFSTETELLENIKYT